MTLDAWLAIAHHLAIFGVAAVLVAELVLVRPGITAADVVRVARIDRSYGLLAVTVILVGIARVAWGATDASYYLGATTFWLKMAAFGTVGLLSIRPTMAFLRWPEHHPSDDEVASAQRFVRAQCAVFLLIPTFAALMARGIGA